MSKTFDPVFQINSGYAEDMFERYCASPSSVSAPWRSWFETFQTNTKTSVQSDQEKSNPSLLSFELNVANLVQNYKTHGHLNAQLNPLTTEDKKTKIFLAQNYGLSKEDLARKTCAGTLIGLKEMTLFDLIQNLEIRFCGTVGAQIEHVEDPEERAWLHAEFSKIREPVPKSTQEAIYRELAKTDALEKTIATKYVGKKRFSIEGADAQIPACESFLEECALLGATECTIAIAHRGRLNFLVHIVGKPLEKLLAEWEGIPHEGLRGDGDVKYHYGYESERLTRGKKPMRISMPFNPSHLEFVDAVVMGETRARQSLYHGGDTNKVVSIVFHGDAAIAGQGIAYETAQMMSLEGYSVGGTVHFVANNQVGFTTDPRDAHSSTYCTDLAKVTGSPIFHINADDVDGLHQLMRLAAHYRFKFKKDIYIDMVCFRRYGHNEADEPTFTQPLLYKLIKEKPAPYENYMNYLSTNHDFSQQELKSTYQNFRLEMNNEFDKVKLDKKKIAQFKALRHAGKLEFGTQKDILNHFDTTFPLAKLKELAKKISDVPQGFQVNAKLARIIVADRKEMAQGHKRIDWGMAELLAYATLLDEGYHLRLAGEDTERGTFSHRHAVLVDAENGAKWNPLSFIRKGSHAQVINSLLSEEAAMGYEYGYSVCHVNCLVLWEAQFGDFANGAQVIIDQFIAPGESKWCQQQGLVLLLPHGMEGQGAEHSSARLERFLQLCAQGNMQVCCFTNASQVYHALRRQMKRNFRKPLVVMTPKSFLRSARSSTTLQELATGHFEEILNDTRIENKALVERILFCSGKIALDLFDALEKDEYKHLAQKTAIIRVEQLYPFHSKKAGHILHEYQKSLVVAWVQEEPANTGAWSYIRFELEDLLRSREGQKELLYFGRSRRPAPAVGLEKRHLAEQEKVIAAALGGLASVEI